MSSNTSYTVFLNDEQVESKSKKDRAIAVADALRGDNPDAVIEVKTGAGTVVHTVRMKGTHSKPWTRTETHDGIEVEVPSTHTVAYTRARVGAVVARANDKSGWLVITASGDTFEAENTKEAREITNQLAADHRKVVEAEKDQAAKDRAAAKEKRDADRQAAREAKDKEKAEKAEAREKAKAEKARLAEEAKAAKEQAKADKAAAAEAEAEAPVEAEVEATA